MKPCRGCIEVYEKFLCKGLGHCVFEGTDVGPYDDKERPEKTQITVQTSRLQSLTVNAEKI